MDHNAMSSKVNNALGVPKQCLFLDNQEVRLFQKISVLINGGGN